MNITINGTQVAEPGLQALNLEEVLLSLARNALPRDHMVGAVRVNGSEFTEIYPRQARDVSVSRISDLEIETVPFSKYSAAAMQDSVVFLERIHASAVHTAELFRMYDETQAHEQFAQLLESLRDLFRFIDACRTSGDLDFNLPAANGTSPSQAWNAITGVLDECMTSQEEGDLVLLADLIEYELAPALQSWQNIFRGAAAARQA